MKIKDMNIDNENNISAKDRDFKAPDDSMSHPKQAGTESEETWAPTDADLNSIGMSREKWTQITSTTEAWAAHVAEGNQQNLELQTELQRKLEEQRQQLDQKWEQRTQKLEALKPSGDIVEDARNYFAAIGLDPNQLESPYHAAFLSGDEEGIKRYFEDQMAIAPAPGREAVQRYYETKHRVINAIIRGYEEKKSEKR